MTAVADAWRKDDEKERKAITKREAAAPNSPRTARPYTTFSVAEKPRPAAAP